MERLLSNGSRVFAEIIIREKQSVKRHLAEFKISDRLIPRGVWACFQAVTQRTEDCIEWLAVSFLKASIVHVSVYC